MRAQGEVPATPSPRVQRAQVWPSRRALTFRHQAVVFILVQLDEGGVPAAVGCAQPAGGLCLPGWGQQRKEALILGGREGAARSGGREGILGGGRCRRQEQHCGAGNRPRMDPPPTPAGPGGRSRGSGAVHTGTGASGRRARGRGREGWWGVAVGGAGSGRPRGRRFRDGAGRAPGADARSPLRSERREAAASCLMAPDGRPCSPDRAASNGPSQGSRRAGAAGARQPTSQRAGRASRRPGGGETDAGPGSAGGRVRVPACHAPAREDKEGRSDH